MKLYLYDIPWESVIFYFINSLWPGDTIWWLRSGQHWWLPDDTSHYRNQCWLLICEILLHALRINFICSAKVTIMYNEFENQVTLTIPGVRELRFIMYIRVHPVDYVQIQITPCTYQLQCTREKSAASHTYYMSILPATVLFANHRII